MFSATHWHQCAQRQCSGVGRGWRQGKCFRDVVQSLSRVQLFVTPSTEAYQASLSFTVSQSLLKLMSIELVMPSNHLIFCHPLLLLPSIFPSIRAFSSEVVKSTGAAASASVLPMDIQG